MTRRQLADHHRNALLQKDRAPRFTTPGNLAFAKLYRLGHLIPALATYPEFRCICCDVLIEPGETAFTSSSTHLPYPTVCYNCGIGWELYHDTITPDEALDVPRFGGPAP